MYELKHETLLNDITCISCVKQWQATQTLKLPMAERRADDFKQAGERALARFTVFGFGQAQKWEDAADNFLKAANSYKSTRSWAEAADMFEKVADLQLKLSSTHDACSAYVEVR
jgi:uncharacterized protein HemY